ncbi:unnamed protein product [Gongylonema pulchrum]|uniref:Fibronectin type-III domain-containing protein n=1 Tax=Gongylonema pulchrum TaxID=637853 RepID=A0A183DTQ3_9BILA|nr:unnamed protein product [Gongylonema pulchrum]
MWTQISVLILLFAATPKAFTVLPYVQIDFVHYFRLAQCDAKCAEKYGKLVKRRLNDGTFIEYYGSDGQEYRLCTAGCNRRRTVSRRDYNGTGNALSNGIQFWMDTNAYAGRTENSPIRSVRVGCMDLGSVEHDDYEDTIEGLIFVDLDEQHRHPTRYIVQWKQRTYDGSPTEENGWITASIESKPTFKVEGMVPSMQYRFMVTAVGPSGRFGGPVMSDWAQSLPAEEELNAPVGPLLVSTQYNTDNGVCALVKWYHSPYQREPSPYDHGNGIMLSNLQFSTEYTVSLRSEPSMQVSPSDAELSNASATALERKFMTPACNEIFGAGSLECAPEPVKNLEALVEPNGTARIQWVPSSEPNTILVYQLIHEPVTEHRDCGQGASSTYVNAAAVTATIQLFGRKHCEYSIKLINYDLIGREASAEILVWYRPNVSIVNSNILLYTVPLSALILAIIVLKCCTCLCCSRSNKNIKPLLSSNQRDTVTLV